MCKCNCCKRGPQGIQGPAGPGCNLVASISIGEKVENTTPLTVTPSNGSGNYTYSWSFASNSGAFSLGTPTNTSSISVTDVVGIYKHALLKVVVTDTTSNCVATDFYLLSHNTTL
jgi:hypothetical protein